MSYERQIVLFPRSNSGLYVSEIARSAGSEDRLAGQQVRSYYVLQLPTKGVLRRCGRAIGRGEAILFPCDIPYGFTAEGEFENFWIGFGGRGAEELLLSLGIPCRAEVVLKVSDPETVESRLRCELENLSLQRNQTGALSALLSLLPYMQSGNPAPGYAEQARSFINGNYSYGITVESIAKSINISAKHLTKLFSKEYGISPKQYLIQTRMQAAQSLLRRTDLLIREIAENVGFPSQFAFSAAYKHYFGISPTAEQRPSPTSDGD